MTLSLHLEEKVWPLKEPFVISRAVHLNSPTLQVRLTDFQGRSGRGEAYGVTYAGEITASMRVQIEAVTAALVDGLTRESLLTVLPPGGARFAIDSALWDLESKRAGVSAFDIAGVPVAPVTSDFTIGIRSPEACEVAGAASSQFEVLKLKVSDHDPIAAVSGLRRGAPGPKLIVDPNQAWSVEQLKAWAPALADLGVDLLEQPIPIGAEAGLDGYDCPVPLCADELINDENDLDRAAGRFDYINIKLDKTGGLTTALRLARTARDRGFRLMVGNMGGSSLSMAPAMVIAQMCDFADLDGPLMQTADIEPGFSYVNGRIDRPWLPDLWG